MVEFYNTFILKYTEAELEVVLDAGKKVINEVGNKLKSIEPPKPPDPNRPATESDDAFGAW